MKKIAFRLIFIPVCVLALAGCKSTSENKESKNNATLVWEFIQPKRDNRFPNESQLQQSSLIEQEIIFDTANSNRSIFLPSESIVRCDSPVTICRHGITNPSVNYTIKQYGAENGRVFISGFYLFELQRSVRSESGTGYLEKSIPEGFPLLPKDSTSIPFSGVSGNGEVIAVSGPYNTTFKISLKINKPV